MDLNKIIEETKRNKLWLNDFFFKVNEEAGDCVFRMFAFLIAALFCHLLSGDICYYLGRPDSVK